MIDVLQTHPPQRGYFLRSPLHAHIRSFLAVPVLSPKKCSVFLIVVVVDLSPPHPFPLEGKERTSEEATLLMQVFPLTAPPRFSLLDLVFGPLKSVDSFFGVFQLPKCDMVWNSHPPSFPSLAGLPPISTTFEPVGSTPFSIRWCPRTPPIVLVACVDPQFCWFSKILEIPRPPTPLYFLLTSGP